MTALKRQSHRQRHQSPRLRHKPNSSTTTGSTTGRKPWIKKTPVEVVLEQIDKQEQKVSEMRQAITKEERELAKLQQARKVLEST